MPAATNKAELHAVTVREFDKLVRLINPISASQANAPHDDTTIKNVIGHRSHWTLLFLGWYADGFAGRPVFFPAEGYKWNDLKRYNADLQAKQNHLSWEDVQTMLHDSYQQLITFIETHDDAALYGAPMKGANNQWTTGRWAEAAGASHYRSAAKYVRAALKANT